MATKKGKLKTSHSSAKVVSKSARKSQVVAKRPAKKAVAKKNVRAATVSAKVVKAKTDKAAKSSKPKKIQPKQSKQPKPIVRSKKSSTAVVKVAAKSRVVSPAVKKTVVPKAVVSKNNKNIKPAGKITKMKIHDKTPSKPPIVEAVGKDGPVDFVPYSSVANEEYMSAAQLKHFEEMLLHWREQLMQKANATIHNMQLEVTNYPDQADRAYVEEEFSRELRARDRERKLLKKIEDTLDRIKGNDYGYCEICGAEIGIKRLEVRPTATQCVECKTIAEMKEKQLGEIEEV